MNNRTWISTAPGHASNMRPFRHSFSDNDLVTLAVDCKKRNMAGEPLGQECFPTDVYAAPGADDKDLLLPDLFYAGSYWVISSKPAAVILDFNAGEGALYPVRVTKRDRETPIGDGWFCLNFGNRKNAIVPAESPKMMHDYIDNGQKGWFAPFATKDGDVAVTASALAGPDIWIDPQVGDAFFLSNPLVTALKKAKADKGFFLSKCRIIGN